MIEQGQLQQLAVTHLVGAISSGDSFTQSNHTFQLTDGDPVRVLAWTTRVILTQRSVFVDQDGGSGGSELKEVRESSALLAMLLSSIASPSA